MADIEGLQAPFPPQLMRRWACKCKGPIRRTVQPRGKGNYNTPKPCLTRCGPFPEYLTGKKPQTIETNQSEKVYPHVSRMVTVLLCLEEGEKADFY